MAPTLRSAEVWLAMEAASGGPVDGVPSPRARRRSAPEIAVVEAPRAVWSSLSTSSAASSGGASLLGEVAREVATTLLNMALGAALGRTFGAGQTPSSRSLWS